MIKKFFYTTYRVYIHISMLIYLFFIYTKKLSLHSQYNMPKTLNIIQIYTSCQVDEIFFSVQSLYTW